MGVSMWRKHEATRWWSEEERKGEEDRGGDTGPLLHCLTSSGIQPRARATNGGASLSPCLTHTHTQQSHWKCTLHVQIWIHARFSAPSRTSTRAWIYTCTATRTQLSLYFLLVLQTAPIFICRAVLYVLFRGIQTVSSRVLYILFSCGKLIQYYHSCKCWCVICETKGKQFSPLSHPVPWKPHHSCMSAVFEGKKGLQCHAAEKSQLIPTSVCCALLNLIQLLKPLWQQLLSFKH